MIEWAGLLYTIGKEVYGYYKDGKEVFDVAKGGYEAVKGIKDHFEVKEGEPKLIDFEWVRKSGFQTHAEAQGLQLGFTRPEKVASRELDGYEIMYEVDMATKTKRKLVLYDKSVLIGKKA